jgi:predicted DNA-binding transcriptional regulator AlpA
MQNTATVTPLKVSAVNICKNDFYKASLSHFLRIGEVSIAVGLAKSTIYKKVAHGEFPMPVSRSGRHVAWTQDSIAAWMAERPVVLLRLKEGAKPWQPKAVAGEGA